jgi:hypothetical protein
MKFSANHSQRHPWGYSENGPTSGNAIGRVAHKIEELRDNARQRFGVAQKAAPIQRAGTVI